MAVAVLTTSEELLRWRRQGWVKTGAETVVGEVAQDVVGEEGEEKDCSTLGFVDGTTWLPPPWPC